MGIFSPQAIKAEIVRAFLFSTSLKEIAHVITHNGQGGRGVEAVWQPGGLLLRWVKERLWFWGAGSWLCHP